MEEITTMSEAEVVKTDEVSQVSTPVEPAKEIRLEDTKIAYVVGMDQEGNFIFQVFGKEAGLLQLLGIHAHATRRVQALYDDKQIAGDRIVHEVGKAVAQAHAKLDQLLAVIAPKAPDNKI